MSTLSSRRSQHRRKFTDEFKADAVAMVEASGGKIAQVARELNIYDSSLGNWVRQVREEAAGAPTAQERAEIRDLKRELERVRVGSVTFWEKQWPTSRRQTYRTGDGDLFVHLRGAGQL